MNTSCSLRTRAEGGHHWSPSCMQDVRAVINGKNAIETIVKVYIHATANQSIATPFGGLATPPGT
jgi:hypothetical protein